MKEATPKSTLASIVIAALLTGILGGIAAARGGQGWVEVRMIVEAYFYLLGGVLLLEGLLLRDGMRNVAALRAGVIVIAIVNGAATRSWAPFAAVAVILAADALAPRRQKSES